ncbi:unnamed protein product [Protopolystoma xenopodis]|uniref:Lipoyl synthase n=1 Tax=Protopolystoma xenopodis TaxID=117903 RepID=A0A3S5AGS6_9PLAT|nr:unnamed protein product [Protopolystoma xenopodis]
MKANDEEIRESISSGDDGLFPLCCSRLAVVKFNDFIDSFSVSPSYPLSQCLLYEITLTTVCHLKLIQPEVLIQCLVPDFRDHLTSVRTVVESGLQVYAHNIENVESLQAAVRDPRAGCEENRQSTPWLTKSSLTLGFGEKDPEAMAVLRDLRAAGIDCLTIGQYIQPTKRHLKAREYLHPDRFAHWKTVADQLGFLYTASGPLVRSSYRAGEFYIDNIIRKQTQPANSVTVSASPHDATTRIV